MTDVVGCGISGIQFVVARFPFNPQDLLNARLSLSCYITVFTTLISLNTFASSYLVADIQLPRLSIALFEQIFRHVE